MRFFVIHVEGENFLVNQEGQTSKLGFIAVHFIEGTDPQVAADQAIEQTRAYPGLRESVLNDVDDPPGMKVDLIEEVDSFEGIDTNPGLIWFPMKAKRWWQFWK